jgi:hypothetical protein
MDGEETTHPFCLLNVAIDQLLRTGLSLSNRPIVSLCDLSLSTFVWFLPPPQALHNLSYFISGIRLDIMCSAGANFLFVRYDIVHGRCMICLPLAVQGCACTTFSTFCLIMVCICTFHLVCTYILCTFLPLFWYKRSFFLQWR